MLGRHSSSHCVIATKMAAWCDDKADNERRGLKQRWGHMAPSFLQQDLYPVTRPEYSPFPTTVDGENVRRKPRSTPGCQRWGIRLRHGVSTAGKPSEREIYVNQRIRHRISEQEACAQMQSVQTVLIETAAGGSHLFTKILAISPCFDMVYLARAGGEDCRVIDVQRCTEQDREKMRSSCPFRQPTAHQFYKHARMRRIAGLLPRIFVDFLFLTYAATANGIHAELSNSDNRRDFSLFSALLSAASASLS